MGLSYLREVERLERLRRRRESIMVALEIWLGAEAADASTKRSTPWKT